MGPTIIVVKDTSDEIYIMYSPSSLLNEEIEVNDEGAFIAQISNEKLSLF